MPALSTRPAAALSFSDITSGNSVGGGTIKNDFGATFHFKSATTIYNDSGTNTFVNAGLVEQTGTQDTTTIAVAFQSTGTVAVASGTMEFDGAGNSFSGAVSGAGAVVLGGGGSTTFAGGATITVASLSLTGSQTQATFAESLNYNGQLSQGAGTTIVIDAGDTLTLKGTTTLSGATTGAGGTLSLAGGATMFGKGASLSIRSLSLVNSWLYGDDRRESRIRRNFHRGRGIDA